MHYKQQRAELKKIQSNTMSFKWHIGPLKFIAIIDIFRLSFVFFLILFFPPMPSPPPFLLLPTLDVLSLFLSLFYLFLFFLSIWNLYAPVFLVVAFEVLSCIKPLPK